MGLLLYVQARPIDGQNVLAHGPRPIFVSTKYMKENVLGKLDLVWQKVYAGLSFSNFSFVLLPLCYSYFFLFIFSST